MTADANKVTGINTDVISLFHSHSQTPGHIHKPLLRANLLLTCFVNKEQKFHKGYFDLVLTNLMQLESNLDSIILLHHFKHPN